VRRVRNMGKRFLLPLMVYIHLLRRKEELEIWMRCVLLPLVDLHTFTEWKELEL